MARADQQVIDITDELWSGEWGPWNAPDRPTPKGPGNVLGCMGFWTRGLLPGRRTWVGRTGISIPYIEYNLTQV